MTDNGELGGSQERRDSLRNRVESAWERWRNGKFGELAGADLRSLAALRIFLGLVLLMDLASRIPNLRVHYTDDGVLPRNIAIANLHPWRWSLSLYNGTEASQWVLFIAAAVAAGFLIIGFHTRTATIVAWILLFSIQTRNPLLLSGADTLLRVLMFWAMLLPLGAHWSLDRRLRTAPAHHASLSMRFVSWATIGLFLQIAFMYWFTALLKTSSVWRSDGTALSYATGAGHVTRPFGEFLHQFPELLRLLTHASFGLEVVVPFLLFCPVRTGPVRTLAAAAIMAFHAGIFLTFNIGIFPWTSALCMVCFLPPWFWDHALPTAWASVRGRSRALRRAGQLATQAVQQGLPGRGAPGSGAILTGAGPDISGAALSAVSPPVPNASPAAIGSSRTMEAQPLVRRSSPFTNGFAAFCLLFVLGWNLTTVSEVELPRRILPFAQVSGLYQSWDMFSPRPPLGTTWYVIRGTLEDGQHVDLLTSVVYDDVTRIGNIAWDEPDDIAGEYYRDKYWRKYLDSIASDDHVSERRAFSAYTCRRWNDAYAGSIALKSIEIMSNAQRTDLAGADRPVQRSIIDTYTC